MIEILPNWHPTFVHFTVALLPLAALLFLLGKLAPATAPWKDACLVAARVNLWIGSIIAVGTVLTGLHAADTVAHDAPSHLAMMNHRNIALVAAGLFISLGLWSFFSRKKEPAMLLVISLLFTTGLLVTAAYKGGELVYRYGLGVLSLPQTGVHHHGGDDHHEEGKGHDHDHGHKHDHGEKKDGHNHSH